MECETYKDLDHKSKVKLPPNSKKIRSKFVNGIKHDGCHNARLATDSHLTETPLYRVHSGLVSLKALD